MKKFFLLIFLFPIFLLGSVSVTVNGSSYTIPQTNERGWGTAVTSWIQAISANTIQPTGGVFTLTNDLDLGATFGLKTNYIKSRNSNISSTGLIRLNNTDFLGWRNFANSGDLTLSVNTSNALLFNSIALADISTAQTFTNKILSFASNTLTGVASTSTAQVITLKDIDGGTASNTSRITLPAAAKTSLDALTRKAGTIVYDTTSSKPYYDDGSSLKAIGSSSGATNYLTLGDAEGGTTGIVVSKNTVAGVRPDTGFVTTGTNITLTTSATAPLSGVNSFIITKDAANRQGEQVYFPFTIDSRDKAKVLQISLDYIVNSGTFAAGSSSTDSDLIPYIYNVTDGVFIEPSSFKFLSNSSTISDKFIANFQTSSTSTSYRLIFHVASTSALAYSLKFEGSVSPSSYVFGTPITDWATFTSGNTQGFGTIASSNLRWRRVGDTMQIQGGFITGTVTGSVAQLGLPSGTIGGITGVRNYAGEVIRNGGTRVTAFAVQGNNYLTFGGGASSHGDVIGSSLVGSTEQVYLFVDNIPISGWSSSVQTSDGFDGRRVNLQLSTNGGAVGTAATTWTIATFTTPEIDDVGGWNGTDTYTVRGGGGDYEVGFMACQNSAAANYFRVGVQKNADSEIVLGQGIGKVGGSACPFGSKVLRLVGGDTIKFKGFTEGTEGIGSTRSAYIKKVLAPTTISATERISAIYNTSSQVMGNGTEDTIKYTVKEIDTHNAYNTTTGLFTAPVAGIYSVTCNMYPSSRSSAVWDFQSMIFVGAARKAQAYNYNGSTTILHLYNSIITKLVSAIAGDTISCAGRAGSTGYTLDGDAQRNYFSIHLVK